MKKKTGDWGSVMAMADGWLPETEDISWGMWWLSGKQWRVEIWLICFGQWKKWFTKNKSVNQVSL